DSTRCRLSFCALTGPPPRSTPFPYTTLFRSLRRSVAAAVHQRPGAARHQRAGRARISRLENRRQGSGGSDSRRLPEGPRARGTRSEEHTSELQSRVELVCRLLLEKKIKVQNN